MIDPADLIAAGLPLEIRPPDPARDSVDGVAPGIVVTPATAEAVAATLRWAAATRLPVVLRGQGSKLGWGSRPSSIGVLVDMSALNQVLAHQPGDLTVTVEAGIRLRDLNRSLAPHGQWLALDPAFPDRATIGGLLATNDSGPQRHRFGTPRDLVIGIRLATVDGQLSKAGGQVVKNVAGYDLSKLITGSFGSLAAIVSATFKLAPMAAASATLVLEDLTIAQLATVAGEIAGSQLEPVAFDLHVRHDPGASAPQIAAFLRFASLPGVVEAELANASRRITSMAPRVRTLADDAEQQLWAAQVRRPWEEPGTVARLAWRPGEIQKVVPTLMGAVGRSGFELTGRLGVGAGFLRLNGTPSDQEQGVSALRASPILGNVFVARAPESLKSAAFVWPPRPDALVRARLKQELDASGIMGAGRGPL